MQVHELERTLEDTIGYLSGLERNSSSMQEALDFPTVLPGSASELPQRERSSNDASTSQV